MYRRSAVPAWLVVLSVGLTASVVNTVLLHGDVAAVGYELRAQLRRIGCKHGQGFLFARPKSAATIRTDLASRRDTARPRAVVALDLQKVTS